jgi:hypothetical protein
MTNHPITPPPELVERWRTDYMGRGHAFLGVAKEIAQWGADQELKACCAWLDKEIGPVDSCDLRADRRPKPPTLKEQALALINSNKPYLDDTAMDTIRKALETIND